MKEDTTILAFRQSESVAAPLTELARQGARRMLAEALKAEADAFVASFAHEQLEDGRQRIVRHGFGPERQIQTGIGALDVQRPKVRDRQTPSGEAEKIRFTSNILPKWARRSISLDALLPVLYLKGISTGDFQEALSAIMGPDAPNLSPSVISRLTAGWQMQYDAWARRDLSARHYVYIWADGVYLQARMPTRPLPRACMPLSTQRSLPAYTTADTGRPVIFVIVSAIGVVRNLSVITVSLSVSADFICFAIFHPNHQL